MLHSFKNRLESFKKKNDLKGKDLAEAAGISAQSVSAYGDSTFPRADVLTAWARKFNLNINWLLIGEGEMLRSATPPKTSASSSQGTPAAASPAVQYSVLEIAVEVLEEKLIAAGMDLSPKDKARAVRLLCQLATAGASRPEMAAVADGLARSAAVNE